MYLPLTPCPSCRRHARIEDGVCPFCATALPEGARGLPSPGRRLARSAVVVLAGSLAVAACGGSETTETKTDAGSSSDGSVDGLVDTGMGTLYGLPPDTGTVDSGTTDSASDAAKDGDGGPDDTGGPAPKYGGPPPPDAG